MTSRALPSQYGTARVTVHPTEVSLGAAAAAHAAGLIQGALHKPGGARIIVGTGNSQLVVIKSLLDREVVDWTRVTVFHMDEYVGICADHPASFRRWLKTNLAAKCHPAAVHYLAGDAGNLDAEIERYSDLLSAAPIDVAFVGFGENGHIAFNDPPNADFSDPALVKVVTLDDACRRQQVNEGHFADFAAVPSRAVTITCPGLLRAGSWVSCVPEARKATAVRLALEGPIGTSCPASVVRTHPQAHVFLDENSAALLSPTVADGRQSMQQARPAPPGKIF